MDKYEYIPKLLQPSGAHGLLRSAGVGAFREEEGGFVATFSGKANDVFYITNANLPKGGSTKVAGQSSTGATVELSLSPVSMLLSEETKDLILLGSAITLDSNITMIEDIFRIAKITLTSDGTVYLFAK